ncbi:UrcA family protein [Novosphingobium sp.]|uniref:UrcA family protein n=1 Tax=Novosphingobium sp. TaxID=1874826 RepID=UPI003341A8D5
MSHPNAWRRAMYAGLALIPACALASAPAHAAPTHASSTLAAQVQAAPDAGNADTDLRKLTVRYPDLDLTTARDRARLETRITRAAALVCGNDDGYLSIATDAEGRRCYYDALARAHAHLAANAQARTLVSR